MTKENIFLSVCLCVAIIIVAYPFEKNKKSSAPSVWIESHFPDGSRHGRCYNDLIKLNDHQYLFVGKDGFGKTFDSTIITINK